MDEWKMSKWSSWPVANGKLFVRDAWKFWINLPEQRKWQREWDVSRVYLLSALHNAWQVWTRVIFVSIGFILRLHFVFAHCCVPMLQPFEAILCFVAFNNKHVNRSQTVELFTNKNTTIENVGEKTSRKSWKCILCSDSAAAEKLLTNDDLQLIHNVEHMQFRSRGTGWCLQTSENEFFT